MFAIAVWSAASRISPWLIATLFLALSRIESGHLTGFMTLAILLVAMVAQAFQGLTLFGFVLFSVLGILFVGLVQPATAERTIQPPEDIGRWLRGGWTRIE